ncbi:MAG: hypothetical protein ACAI44_29685 [Candidatus Sericytochromatia bacterium]
MKRLSLAERKEMVRATELAFEELSSGSKMPEDRAKQFLLKMREQATLKPYIDVLPINSSNKLIMPWMEAPDQIMDSPQGFLNPADYNFAWVDTGDDTVETFPVEAMVFVKDDWKEGNFQGMDGWDVALSLLTQVFFKNMEEAGLYSDELGPAILESELKKDGSTTQYIKHRVRANYDGWLTQMEDGVVIDAENSDDQVGYMGEALLAWPERYEEFMEDARWFVPPMFERIDRLNLAKSETALGDLARNGKFEQNPLGIPFQKVPTLKSRPYVVEHHVLTGTTAETLDAKYLAASDLVLLPGTLGTTPTTPYVQGGGGSYTFNPTTSEIARTGSGGPSSGATVKAWIRGLTQIFLTFPKNLIMGLTKDISVTPWRYEPGHGTIYIIRARMAYTLLRKEACIKIKHIKSRPMA